MSTHAPRDGRGPVDEPADDGLLPHDDPADDDLSPDDEGPRDDEVTPANAALTMIMFALFVGATIACYFIFDWH